MSGSRWMIYGLIAIAIVVLIRLMQWQRTLQNIPAGLEVEPAQPQDFPRLNHPLLSQYTAELAELGCTPLGDYRATAEVGVMPPCFIRLLHHPNLGYYVVLTQRDQKTENNHRLGCAVSSLLEDEWMIRTTNERPTPMTSLGHLPRRLWFSQPHATVTQLVEHHLKQRQQMIDQLQISVRHDRAEADFWIKVKENAWRQKQRLKRQNLVLSFLKALYFTYRPQYEWLGENTDAAQQKS